MSLSTQDNDFESASLSARLAIRHLVRAMAEKVLDPLKNILQELRETFNITNAIGEPIVFEDKTLIPIIGIGLGAGGGNGEGKAANGSGSGGGFGVGGILRPIAILVIFKGMPGPDGIKVIELKTGGGLLDALGEVIPKLAEMLPFGFGSGISRKVGEKEKAKLMEV